MDKSNDSNENNRTVFTFGQDVIVRGNKAKIVHKAGEGHWTVDVDGTWINVHELEIFISPKSNPGDDITITTNEYEDVIPIQSTPTDKKTTAEEDKKIKRSELFLRMKRLYVYEGKTTSEEIIPIIDARGYGKLCAEEAIADLRTIEECDQMLRESGVRLRFWRGVAIFFFFAIISSGITFIALKTSPLNIPKHNDSLAPSNTLQENIRTTSPQADSAIRAIKMKRILKP